ncbi:kinase-like domain-containing protein [Microdochium trichocladiopsis]|uniref:non-specific serine/threonine protein kinase n=1 Tax=Microdochium trichocladiopsis TaxID=1682393 RepID=A0A9P8YB65_9PEZI|nr:kinase-like domain-containing protein [Microdochium trichocladiopsis]KAH7035166.1 kinase-like domain-containing protein [Microdochium trichocladiopsis]
MRVLKSETISALQGGHHKLVDQYKVLKILGKGSFGVVQLVQPQPDISQAMRAVPSPPKVYAMKVIRKSRMLKSTQEGHLRAERDFLVASEGSEWIVPLVASFEDLKSLYLVMEYMPGGDFLGLLIRENILSEPTTKFYIAEMILGIEEAHALGCIHRDIKPENFLITASGHLRISDFGLAFDGHWSHETSYYHSQRYSLLHKLGIVVDGDVQDRKESCDGFHKGAHSFTAASCVGTSQYMAPEVIRDGKYDARCDWWSLGIILFECLYGHTPFLSEDGGRQATKHNIVHHKETFVLPQQPLISRRGHHLITSLICEQEDRLSSPRYRLIPSDNAPGFTMRDRQKHKRAERPIVYPYDAEDIKEHPWFRDVPWDRLNQINPPWIPCISSQSDTRYFEEEEPVSDWSESVLSVSSASEDQNEISPKACEAAGDAQKTCFGRPLAFHGSQRKLALLNADLSLLPRHLRSGLVEFVNSPYDSQKLKRMDREIKALVHNRGIQERVKNFVPKFGRRERKRARDRLLRDRRTKDVVLQIRRQTAFVGYSYLRK